jgi:hypothetical protein
MAFKLVHTSVSADVPRSATDANGSEELHKLRHNICVCLTGDMFKTKYLLTNLVRHRLTRPTESGSRTLDSVFQSLGPIYTHRKRASSIQLCDFETVVTDRSSTAGSRQLSSTVHDMRAALVTQAIYTDGHRRARAPSANLAYLVPVMMHEHGLSDERNKLMNDAIIVLTKTDRSFTFAIVSF